MVKKTADFRRLREHRQQPDRTILLYRGLPPRCNVPGVGALRALAHAFVGRIQGRFGVCSVFRHPKIATQPPCTHDSTPALMSQEQMGSASRVHCRATDLPLVKFGLRQTFAPNCIILWPGEVDHQGVDSNGFVVLQQRKSRATSFWSSHSTLDLWPFVESGYTLFSSLCLVAITT